MIIKTKTNSAKILKSCQKQLNNLLIQKILKSCQKNQ